MQSRLFKDQQLEQIKQQKQKQSWVCSLEIKKNSLDWCCSFQSNHFLMPFCCSFLSTRDRSDSPARGVWDLCAVARPSAKRVHRRVCPFIVRVTCGLERMQQQHQARNDISWSWNVCYSILPVWKSYASFLVSPLSKRPSENQTRNLNNTRTHPHLEGCHPMALDLLSPPKPLILMNSSGSSLQVNLCERSLQDRKGYCTGFGDK